MSSRAWAACRVGTAAAFVLATAAAQSAPLLSSVFVQAGTTGIVRSASLGATSDWSTSGLFGLPGLGGHWEGSVAEWSYHGPDGALTHLTQFGLKPVLRVRFAEGASPWFVEAGIGVTLTNRQYVSDRKTFSTRFNFGDHLAVGRAFGEGDRHELALRIEHFSNGGIHEPNPGETFAQLRYAFRFR